MIKSRSWRHLFSHLPDKQIGRYLIVGVWNTAFGYGVYAGLTAWLDRYVPASYLAASLLASLINITVSFLGYKWFVFKTRGHYWQEWTRCVLVYSGGIVIGLILLPPMVWLVTHVTDDARSAPYIAGGLLLGLQVIWSFLGHKTFSFRHEASS